MKGAEKKAVYRGLSVFEKRSEEPPVVAESDDDDDGTGPPGQVRNASVATKNYMRNAEKEPVYRGLSVFGMDKSSAVESDNSDSDSMSSPPGKVRNASVATKDYMKNVEPPVYRGNSVVFEMDKSPSVESDNSDSMSSPPGQVRNASVATKNYMKFGMDKSPSVESNNSDSMSSPPGQVRNASVATKQYMRNVEPPVFHDEPEDIFGEAEVENTVSKEQENAEQEVTTEVEKEVTTEAAAPEVEAKISKPVRSPEALLKAIMMIEDLTSKRMGWEYKDTKGAIHGPYSTRQMRHWFVKGCFSLRLPVRHVPKGRRSIWAAPFQKIGDIFRPSHSAFDTTDALKSAKRYLEESLKA